MTVREYVTIDGRIKSILAVGDAREGIEIGFQVNCSAHAKTKGYVEDVITDTRQEIGGSRSECCDEETGTKKGCCKASTQSRGRERS